MKGGPNRRGPPGMGGLAKNTRMGK